MKSCARSSTRSRRFLRGVPVALAAAFVLPLAAGCGAGSDAPTLQVVPDHPSGDVGPMAVRSLMLVTPPDGGEGAALVTLVNRSDEPQRLESLDVGTRTIQAGIEVPPGGSVNVGASGQPSLPVSDLDEVAAPGSLVPVTLIFDKAGRLTLDTIVTEASGPFASFLPTPSTSG